MIVLFAASLGVTVTLKGVPAVAVDGAETLKWSSGPMPVSPAAKSLNDVKPLPVTVVLFEDDEVGALQLAPSYLRTISALVFGLPTRSPGLANVNCAL